MNEMKKNKDEMKITLRLKKNFEVETNLLIFLWMSTNIPFHPCVSVDIRRVS